MSVILFAAVLATALMGNPGAGGQDRPKTTYETLFPNPTGKNGFEDYVLAALAARDATRDIYEPKWTSEYERHRAIASRGERAFALMREGNKKLVSDPRTTITLDTVFPELIDFKNLCRLAQSDMYVRFADGDTAGATTTFIDTATFVERSLPLPHTLGCLVMVQQDAILLMGFEQFAHRLTIADVDRIEAYVRQRKRRVVPLDKALLVDITSFEEMLQLPPDQYMGYIDDEDDHAEALEAFRDMPEHERRPFIAQAIVANRRHAEHLAEMYKSPESSWKLIELEMTGNNTVDALLHHLGIGVFSDQMLLTVAKQRTQWRLLLLHCLIEKYRILHAKLPQSLADLQRNDDIADPLTDDLFVYKPVSVRDFELYSKGTELTGPIAIRYRRQQTAEGVAADPPPPARSLP